MCRVSRCVVATLLFVHIHTHIYFLENRQKMKLALSRHDDMTVEALTSDNLRVPFLLKEESFVLPSSEYSFEALFICKALTHRALVHIVVLCFMQHLIDICLYI